MTVRELHDLFEWYYSRALSAPNDGSRVKCILGGTVSIKHIYSQGLNRSEKYLADGLDAIAGQFPIMYVNSWLFELKGENHSIIYVTL